MIKRYKLHYGDYAVDENERLYEDMAEKGWLLKKRGVYFSSFKKAEPQRIKYHIELSVPNELPENIKTAYEDSGWSLVTSKDFVNVFSSAKECMDVDVKLEPEEKIKLVKSLKSKCIFSLISVPLLIGFYFLLSTITTGIGELKADLYNIWLQQTSLFLLSALWLLFNFYMDIHRVFGIKKLLSSLKSNNPINQGQRNSSPLHIGICRILIIAMMAFGLLTLVQLAGRQKYDMPLVADGPYLLIEDLGVEGTRDPLSYQNKESSVRITKSLMAKSYDTFESLKVNGSEQWMYNIIYDVKGSIDMEAVIDMLMRRSVFGKEPDQWTYTSIEGLDAAYLGKSGIEYIAVKGNRVWHITYGGTMIYSEDFDNIKVLEAIAKL